MSEVEPMKHTEFAHTQMEIIKLGRTASQLRIEDYLRLVQNAQMATPNGGGLAMDQESFQNLIRLAELVGELKLEFIKVMDAAKLARDRPRIVPG